MDTEISEIEKTIKDKIEEERLRSTEELFRGTDAAVERVNGVFASCMKTLEQLKLVDSDLFKFFWKTKGNVKVVEFEPRYDGLLGLALPEGTRNFPDMPLREKKKYRIIVMVTEIEG